MEKTVNFKSQNPKSKHTDPSLPDLLENTPVTTKAKHPNTGQTMEFNGIFICWDKDNDACILVPDLAKKVFRKPNKFKVLTNTTVEEVFKNPSTPAVAEGKKSVTDRIPEPAKQLEPAKVFDINKRFKFLAQLVKMVVKGQAVSAIISGGGGLGKTYTVMGQVQAAGLREVGGHYIDLEEDERDLPEGTEIDASGDYKVIKGFSTAKGLYNTLYYNRKKLVIFDDCDSVLQNDVAVNILKGALDSYDKRVITWQAQAIAGSEIPNEFEFEGQVIFISNMPQNKIPQALISRSTTIDVSMTTPEKLERIKSTLPYLRPDVSMEIKEEAFKVLEQWADHAKDLNFRTMLKVINIFTSAEKYETREEIIELAEYMILSQ